jgi:hypothetical protein
MNYFFIIFYYKKMDSFLERGICCFCNEDCNPLSQACGSCMRGPPIYVNYIYKKTKPKKNPTPTNIKIKKNEAIRSNIKKPTETRSNIKKPVQSTESTESTERRRKRKRIISPY